MKTRLIAELPPATRGERQCTATRTGNHVKHVGQGQPGDGYADGNPEGRCRNYALRGQLVCKFHGGNAPNSLAAAKAKLVAMVDPALEGLLRAMTARGLCAHCGRADDMSTMVRAAQIVLDRVGLGPSQSIAVSTDHTERTKALQDMSKEEFEAHVSALAERAKLLALPRAIDIQAQEVPDDGEDTE